MWWRLRAVDWVWASNALRTYRLSPYQTCYFAHPDGLCSTFYPRRRIVRITYLQKPFGAKELLQAIHKPIGGVGNSGNHNLI
jgi:hypothetical protein